MSVSYTSYGVIGISIHPDNLKNEKTIRNCSCKVM